MPIHRPRYRTSHRMVHSPFVTANKPQTHSRHRASVVVSINSSKVVMSTTVLRCSLAGLTGLFQGLSPRAAPVPECRGHTCRRIRPLDKTDSSRNRTTAQTACCRPPATSSGHAMSNCRPDFAKLHTDCPLVAFSRIGSGRSLVVSCCLVPVS